MSEAEDMQTDELRGSAPAMTTKDLLLEVYKDMKFVRPAVEGLLAAGVVNRIEMLERDHLAATALGIGDELVKRVSHLEDLEQDRATAGKERRRIGDLTNKSIAAVIVLSNFALGLVVFLVNILGTA